MLGYFSKKTEINYSKIKRIGIDDFAKRKRISYYTVIVDHDTRKIIEVIDSRLKDAVVETLKKYTSVVLVSRDCSSSYKSAINEALPNAKHVVDRFHLTKELAEFCQKEIEYHIKSNLLIFDESDNFITHSTARKNKSTLTRYTKTITSLLKEGKRAHKIYKYLRQKYNDCNFGFDAVKDYCKYLLKEILIEGRITIKTASLFKLLFRKKINDNGNKFSRNCEINLKETHDSIICF